MEIINLIIICLVIIFIVVLIYKSKKYVNDKIINHISKIDITINQLKCNHDYDRTSPNNRLKIEPVVDGISTAVSQYKVTDDLGSIWMVGTREECDEYLYGR